MVNIVIARDFSKTPFGRFLADSPNSAERFRRDFLVPAFKSDDQQVVVDFTGIIHGIGSSFLEEAFGGLVRKEGMPKSQVQKKLVIKSEMPFYRDQIFKFIETAKPERT